MAKSKHHKKAHGGHVGEKGEKEHINEYNAKGSPEEHEAMDEKDSFKRGGHKHKKRASGGAILGNKSAVRLDKRARGGAMKSPFSAAYHESMPAKQTSGKGSGHEDEQPGEIG
jgi:hypothetical protein